MHASKQKRCPQAFCNTMPLRHLMCHRPSENKRQQSFLEVPCLSALWLIQLVFRYKLRCELKSVISWLKRLRWPLKRMRGRLWGALLSISSNTSSLVTLMKKYALTPSEVCHWYTSVCVCVLGNADLDVSRNLISHDSFNIFVHISICKVNSNIDRFTLRQNKNQLVFFPGTKKYDRLLF